MSSLYLQLLQEPPYMYSVFNDFKELGCIEYGSQKHNYICNIQDVSVYTNVSSNYMFRHLLVRPSSVSIQRSEEL